MTKVYIVGRSIEQNGVRRWEFMGVFDTEDKALAICTRWEYFIGPAVMNLALPHDSEPWPGCYSPMAEAHTAGRCLADCPCKADASA